MNNRKSKNNSRSISREKDDFSDLSDQDIPISIHRSNKEGYGKKISKKNKPRSFNNNFDNYSMSNKFRKQKSGYDDNISMKIKRSYKNYGYRDKNDSFRKKYLFIDKFNNYKGTNIMKWMRVLKMVWMKMKTWKKPVLSIIKN